MEDVFVIVCLLATLHKNVQTDLHEFSGKVGNEPMNKWLNFGGDPDDRLDKVPNLSLLGGMVSG